MQQTKAPQQPQQMSKGTIQLKMTTKFKRPNESLEQNVALSGSVHVQTLEFVARMTVPHTMRLSSVTKAMVRRTSLQRNLGKNEFMARRRIRTMWSRRKRPATHVKLPDMTRKIGT